tara:strand:- start:189 stop:290 length:102 start_codon:yes stop_codon:yes gene_type:complete
MASNLGTQIGTQIFMMIMIDADYFTQRAQIEIR